MTRKLWKHVAASDRLDLQNKRPEPFANSLLSSEKCPRPRSCPYSAVQVEESKKWCSLICRKTSSSSM